MFGYLPAPCRCQVGDRVDMYRSLFCGLCNALAKEYGQLSRLLTNRDSAFIALLAAAQTQEPLVATPSACCQPWRRPIPVFENGSIPAFAGAITLCGLQAKLEDERADERGLPAAGSRVLSALLQSRFSRAQAILAASGFPVADVRRQLGAQASVEDRVSHGGDPIQAAQPTAQAFGSILAHTARLAGRNANIDPLYQAGRGLGELAYTLDAYQDLNADGRHGRFNFLASQTRAAQPDNPDRMRSLAREIAAACQQQIQQAWQGVELLRHRPLLEAVLLAGLPAKTARILIGGPGHPLMIGDSGKGRENHGSATCWDSCYYCHCPGCGDCGGCDCGGCDGGGCDCGSCDCSGCDCNC